MKKYFSFIMICLYVLGVIGGLGWTLYSGGYVIADESTKTNIPGVYAVGDVRIKKVRQIVTAVADGAVAAHEAEEYLAEIK